MTASSLADADEDRLVDGQPESRIAPFALASPHRICFKAFADEEDLW